MRVARRYVISGRVQGVGYRMFVVDAARRDGLSGHVRNLPDGQVEAAAEGEAEAMTRFEAALWRGPARARIEAIAVDETAPTGHAGAFAFN